jgi:hypothetical protein
MGHSFIILDLAHNEIRSHPSHFPFPFIHLFGWVGQTLNYVVANERLGAIPQKKGILPLAFPPSGNPSWGENGAITFGKNEQKGEEKRR